MTNKDISKEEKLNLVAARIRGVKVDKFNAELNLVEQNALENPDSSVVASADKVISNAALQITALEAQYTSIQAGQYTYMDTPKTKNELMIIALQQRIGEMTANYEGQIASLRADLTQLMQINDIVSSDAKTKEVGNQCLR